MIYKKHPMKISLRKRWIRFKKNFNVYPACSSTLAFPISPSKDYVNIYMRK